MTEDDILLKEIPHPLDTKYRFLSVSRLADCPSVVIVSLDRPRKRNAINATMWKEIGHVFRELGTGCGGTSGKDEEDGGDGDGDGDCRCVLLRGNGRSFCSGIDVTDPSLLPPSASSSSDDDDDKDEEDYGEEKYCDYDVARRGMSFRYRIEEMQRCFTSLEEGCRVPVVAAIHGHCVGAGVDLVSCADVRLCAASALFSVREVRLGLAADIGTLQRFPKIVGHHSRVRELCYTGDDFTAREAHRIGFVGSVVAPPHPNENHNEDHNEDHNENEKKELFRAALGICRRIAERSPVAVMGTKSSLLYSRDRTVEDGLRHVALHNSLALMTDDMALAFAEASATATAAAGGGKKRQRPTFAKMPPISRL